MWRAIHGGLPEKRHPQVLVVYAGADDLEPPFGCQDDAVEVASNRITLLLDFLSQKMPSTAIIYMAIMPHVRPVPVPLTRVKCPQPPSSSLPSCHM